MILAWYHRCMTRRPFATQIVTSVIIGAAGDMLAQHLTLSHLVPLSSLPMASSPSLDPSPNSTMGPDMSPHSITGDESYIENIDWHRVGIMSLYSGCFAAPLVLTWLKALDRLPLKSLLVRVAIDQLCFSPFGLAYYFVITGLLYRQSVTIIRSNLHQNYSVALLRNYQIWPVVQAINFYYIPLSYRLLFTQAVALGWNAYLSLLFHKHEIEEA